MVNMDHKHRFFVCLMIFFFGKKIVEIPVGPVASKRKNPMTGSPTRPHLVSFFCLLNLKFQFSGRKFNAIYGRLVSSQFVTQRLVGSKCT